MKSTTMIPPRLRTRSWRAIACAASRFVRKIVSSKVAPADVASGIDVDRRQRLGLVDDQVAARLQVDAARQRALDLVLHAVELEQRPLAAVQADLRRDPGHVGAGERDQPLALLRGVDLDHRGALAGDVAQYPLRQAQLLVEQRRRRLAAAVLEDLAPAPAQVVDVGGELGLVRVFRRGPDDEAATLVGRHQALQPRLELHALALALDALRNADVRILRQVDQQAPGDADLRRQPRALGAQRILDHLHQQRLALEQQLLDRRRVARALGVGARLPEVGHVKEGGALQADVDEGGLHARQHARDLAQVDVAGQPAGGGALEVELLHDARLHERDRGSRARCS